MACIWRLHDVLCTVLLQVLQDFDDWAHVRVVYATLLHPEAPRDLASFLRDQERRAATARIAL